MRSGVHKPSQWRMKSGSIGWPNLASTSLSLPFMCWFIRCCARVVGDLDCICMKCSERSPPHLFLYLVLIQKQKYRNKLTALLILRTRELLKFIETKILISPWHLLKQGWIKVASAWVCHAIFIQNLVLPFHLNSANDSPNWIWFSCRG